MVMLGHLLSDAITRMDPESVCYVMIYGLWKLAASAVYAFLFASAAKLFLADRPDFSLKSFYLRRLRSVAAPYALAVLVYTAAGRIMGAPFGWRQLAENLFLGTGAAHFYFIVVIVQFYALMPLWRAMVRRLDAVVVVPASLVLALVFRECLKLYLGNILPQWVLTYQDRFFITYLPVWTAGCYAGAHYTAFLDILARNRRLICIAFVLLLPLNTLTEYLQGFYSLWTTAAADLNYAFEMACVLTLFLLSLRLSRTRLPRLRLFAALDRATYLIYLYHLLVLSTINHLLQAVGVVGIGGRFACCAILLPAATISGCMLWQAFGRRIRGRTAGKS